MREVRQVCESHTNSFENLKSMLGADGCNVGKYHWRTYICTNHLQKGMIYVSPEEIKTNIINVSFSSLPCT